MTDPDVARARVIWKGQRARRIRRQVLDASSMCWLCGHDLATTVDHAIPIAVRPDLVLNPDNLRPAHGVTGCPTCHRKCNQSRGASMVITRPTHGSRDW